MMAISNFTVSAKDIPFIEWMSEAMEAEPSDVIRIGMQGPDWDLSDPETHRFYAAYRQYRQMNPNE